MGLDKAITHGKEHRKPYRGSKAFDRSCRNHKSCPRCQGSRTIAVRRQTQEDPRDTDRSQG